MSTVILNHAFYIVFFISLNISRIKYILKLILHFIKCIFKKYISCFTVWTIVPFYFLSAVTQIKKKIDET